MEKIFTMLYLALAIFFNEMNIFFSFRLQHFHLDAENVAFLQSASLYTGYVLK